MIRRLALASILICAAGAALAQCRADRVDLRGDWGQAGFSVELAVTPQQRARGLMYRQTLPRGAGMLFVYDPPQHVSFWMKNTLIPLDMLFLDRQGVVRRVHSDATPGDLTPIDGGEGIFAVLEINAGLARRYGIAPGTVMRHPIFSQGPAVWPC
ncbi:DUF192 domain-containing protein [Pseudodonghicola xiamenensis]|uniref:DUF192 domain-containing protein n=1 Tax=Pseudodonghicola xiamenensis TaxID=337702 RepID=A0A8J3MBW5_9RHOB|nr:DUF192 domain-containing protein [Pseudodonghicola xiamenensis]GHG87731.1 hypothetical protein GCM10010961_16430 [Pseudodonghicola xiamenensis]